MIGKSSDLGPPIRGADYGNLLRKITSLLEMARRAAARSVNTILTATYWEMGRRIVEFEQHGARRAEYGKRLLERLSKDLSSQFGKGFGYSNLNLIRQFYLTYSKRIRNLQTASGEFAGGEKSRVASALLPPATGKKEIGVRILQTVSGEFPLSWSHYVRIMGLDELEKREFYEEEAHRAGWSVRQLDRQINSMLYERVALSRKKGELLRRAEQRPDVVTAGEEIKDPYVLEFLGLPEPYSEKDLESALIRHLADFLLELGYGFTFVARQKRLQIGSESYYIDLLFYHRHLRCLVVIDLKIGKFTHADVGQMNLYLNYLRDNATLEGENPPIGLILCAEKDEAVAQYALGGLNNKMFASRYKLQLPDPKILKREIEAERRRLEERFLKSKEK
jgi:predicted nuclease of restriction endonuclease-like (RecB) superfamily